jgi:hypothetical protein
VTPERWQQVSALFQRALEAAPADRARLLHEETAGDPDLRREVESLLAAHQQSGAFLDEPAWGVAAHLILDRPDEDSLTGRQLGPYRVLEEIGRGGMGVVYAAEDPRLERTVALKALPPEWTADPRRRERLRREARSAAALSHPAIATVFALEEIDGALYLLSELVRGRTLRAELADGPIASERLLPTLCDIAAALTAAHAQGIVHRDLKPENILRRTDGQIKILDFGLARSGDVRDTPDPRLTEAGLPMGTPGYMAPEQAAGLDADARSDIFAFGVLAWEFATGTHPLASNTGARPEPPALAAIIARCLQARPEDRYPSAEALCRDLQALGAGGERTAGNAWWWWRFHQAALSILAAGAPIAAWAARGWIGRPQGSWVFYSVLMLATVSVTLRLNLLFTARVHPASLGAQRARVFPALAASDTLLAAALAGAALLLAGAQDELGAILVVLAIVLVASLALVEPATTRAAERQEMQNTE